VRRNTDLLQLSPSQKPETSMRTNVSIRRLTPFVLVMIAAVGCSDNGPKRYGVTGKVTYKTQPVAQGTIQFLPEDEKTPSMATAVIEKGEYTIPTGGLAIGKYRIIISSGDPKQKAEEAAPGMSGPPAKELLPAKYNAKTTLKAEIKDIDPNVIPFDLD